MKNTFDILLLLARPAAGKSEIIHYLKHTPLEERTRRFHIGEIDEIDDFPMLWTWFEEDEILERMGKPRLHSDASGYFLYPHLWDVLIERIDKAYAKKVRDDPDHHQQYTTLVEFSRGSEHGGYASAFKHLSSAFARHTAILYVDVPYEESLRKNRARFNPEKPDSILQHALSDEKMERLYKDVDWQEVSANDPNVITIAGEKVPYVVFDNHADLTTPAGNPLGKALEGSLGGLWQKYNSK